MQWENSRTKERRKSHLRFTWLLDAKQVITDIACGEADLDTLKAGASLIPVAKITKVPKVVKAIGNVGKTGFKKGKEGEKIAKSGQAKQTKAKNKGGSGSSINVGTKLGERRISQELYNELKRSTPSKEIQKMVNKDIKDLIGKPDLVLPGKVIEGTLQADHIVSMDKITRMKGFEKLTKAQQKQVLNNKKNFIGLSEAANKSKGSKSDSEWTECKKEGIQINPEFRKEMMCKENELEKVLQEQIDHFVKENNK